MDVSQISDQMLEENIVRALERWRKGELYTGWGLSESVPIISPGDRVPEMNEEDHLLNKLYEVVTEVFAEEFGLGKRDKKRIIRKFYENAFKWAQFVIDKGGSQVPQSPKNSKKAAREEPTPTKGASPAKKKKQQKKKTPEKVAATSMDATDEGATQRLLEAKHKGRALARDLILDEVPESVKNRFGQIYFSKWRKSLLPVLVLSPYKVPPGQVRKTWMKMFNKLRDEDRLQNMTNLIYWYGAYDDPSNAFSFVATSKLVSFEAAQKKKHDELPAAIQNRLDSNKPLDAGQQLLVKGLEEMKDDELLDASDRTGRLGGDFSSDEEDEVVVKTPEPKKSSAKKPGPKKSSKKRKAISNDENVSEDVAQDSVPATANKKVKKSKKKQKKKIESDGNVEIDSSQVVEDPLKDTTSESPKKVDIVYDEIEDIGDDDESSNDDRDADYNYAMADSMSEDDKDDEDFLAATSTSKQVTLKKKTNMAKKEPPKKKESKAKIKLDKPKKEKKTLTEEKRRKLEQKRFSQCERTYLPIVTRWQKAIQERNKEAILKIYDEILPIVGDLHNCFITEYNLSPLMKESKAIADGPNRKPLMTALKKHYLATKDSLPVGFRPKKMRVKDEPQASDKSHAVKKQRQSMDVDSKKPDTQADSQDTISPLPTNIADTSGTGMKEEPASNSLRRNTSLPKMEAGDTARQPGTPIKAEKKKKFSLGKLMRPSTENSKSIQKSNSSGRLAPVAQPVAQKEIKMPEWVTGSTKVEQPPTDETRAFALEFLQQATPFIPQKKKELDRNAIALALEASIHAWASSVSKADWIDKYWQKVDDIVAAMSGEKGTGSLARLIADGKFQSPDDVVNLSDDMIMNSFLGKPVRC